MLQNTPNPFSPQTDISIDLVEDSQVILEIYDIHGHLVRQLMRDVLVAGRHHVGWDATDNFGNAVPDGIYFYRVSVGEYVKTHKMIVLKA